MLMIVPTEVRKYQKRDNRESLPFAAELYQEREEVETAWK